jgi:phospholipase/carboxylesterase
MLICRSIAQFGDVGDTNPVDISIKKEERMESVCKDPTMSDGSAYQGLAVNVARETGERLLLLVHGYGADENDLAPLTDLIDPEGRFLTLCPRGPFDLTPGTGAAWYDRDTNGDVDQVSFCGSLVLLDQLVDGVCAKTGLEPSEMVIIGFSQGAAMALASSLRDSTRPRPAGVAALSGSIPEQSWLEYGWSAHDLPPVYVQHGLDDQVVSVDQGRRTRDMLRGHGIDVEYHEYPMQHEINGASLADLRTWLGKR